MSSLAVVLYLLNAVYSLSLSPHIASKSTHRSHRYLLIKSCLSVTQSQNYKEHWFTNCRNYTVPRVYIPF